MDKKILYHKIEKLTYLLIDLSGLPMKQIHIRIIKSHHLNFELFRDAGDTYFNLCLTTYDIKHLSKYELAIGIAHEIGHIKDSGPMAMTKMDYLILLGIFCIVFKAVGASSVELIIAFIIGLALTHLLVSRRAERIADALSVRLVSRTAFTDLMDYLISYDHIQLTTVERQTQALINQPLVYLYASLCLKYLKLHYWLQNHTWFSGHPSPQQRMHDLGHTMRQLRRA